MFITLITILCTIQTLTQQCICLNLLDLSNSEMNSAKANDEYRALVKYEPYRQVKNSVKPKRRYWLLNDKSPNEKLAVRPRVYEDEKDSNLKLKIQTLVEQTMHDAQRKMKSVETIKNDYTDNAPYKTGFILSLVKKSKDVLDELFNVAVKHRDDWLALEQLKIFELIVHTNVDTTNLLRQLVDIHVKHLNARQSKRRIIMI